MNCRGKKRLKRIQKKKTNCEYIVHISEYILAPCVIEIIVLINCFVILKFLLKPKILIRFTWQEFVPRERETAKVTPVRRHQGLPRAGQSLFLPAPKQTHSRALLRLSATGGTSLSAYFRKGKIH